MAAPEASITPQLEEAVSKVRKDIESIRNRAHLGEASTQMFLILPLIKALGWKELEHITLEHQISGGNVVDIALVVDEQPVVFVESKRLITELSPREASQVLGYAASGGVRWCLLTNGQQYQLYDRSLEVELPENLVFSVDLLEAKEEEVIAKLGLLSLYAVTSGQLERTGAKWYILTHLLGWMQERDERLVELVKNRFLDKAGAVLKNDDVAEILASLSNHPVWLHLDQEQRPKVEPPILYTGWRLEGDTLYVTKTNGARTNQWEERLSLQEFDKLAEAACQLAEADEEITAPRLSEKVKPAIPDKLCWPARLTLAVLYYADIASYVGGQAPVRWRVQQGLTAEKILATVKEMHEAGKLLEP